MEVLLFLLFDHGDFCRDHHLDARDLGLDDDLCARILGMRVLSHMNLFYLGGNPVPEYRDFFVRKSLFFLL